MALISGAWARTGSGHNKLVTTVLMSAFWAVLSLYSGLVFSVCIYAFVFRDSSPDLHDPAVIARILLVGVVPGFVGALLFGKWFSPRSVGDTTGKEVAQDSMEKSGEALK
jgi:hypothetical protein